MGTENQNDERKQEDTKQDGQTVKGYEDYPPLFVKSEPEEVEAPAEATVEKEKIPVYIPSDEVEGWLSGKLVDSAQLETLINA